MARASSRTWQLLLAVAAVLALIGWIASGHIFTAIAALFLIAAMAGGALLYRFMGPPKE